MNNGNNNNRAIPISNQIESALDSLPDHRRNSSIILQEEEK
jgi:hypothetical protein